ncbi:UDP-N-acetylmuramate dehydrogenase [bacterium]|jgi:UDP-N-acetylmuramate dehydrogenase|nr:UDP-N-acetylmuramate dehydrogenase [bacterium]MBT4121366.1 UDP-N-acetylmuramate dehydrogenase [bacterium]MBT4335130.1 UDP-N-acetylmuramate dehydrogenase [bacterium]MBT4495370.1 UDP-N-acetylmuramate dehydrogenase [bacterium]MBT4764105.1 UDP-N-acetylmuramate dehydrogenase [bacterium]
MLDKFKKIDPDIKENFSLKEFTTFKIGGNCKYFSLVKDVKQLVELIKLARSNNVPIQLIGGGSNILISDNGFSGLVIKLQFNTLEIKDTNVEVSADIELSDLINQTVNSGLISLAVMMGIPGTIGGAVVGNAGAYGIQISNFFEKATVLDNNLEVKELSCDDLDFKYRHSILKENDWIVLNINLKLEKGDRDEALKKMSEIVDDRESKHPGFPSAGSTFKNIEINDEVISILKDKNIEIPNKFIEYKKIPAAFLIDHLGLKGKIIGGAQISDEHANHIINAKDAKADHVVQLISFVKMKVRDEIGIQLKEEVRYIGF